ncbi:MAG: GTP-binding protein HSR1, partial [Dehalococcoidia bacterium]
ALADAAGVSVVTDAVERAVRARGSAATGWPPLRWLGRFRADPLRTLHLTGRADERGRTSLPGPTRVQAAALSSALRRVRDSAGDDLPEAWRDDLRRTIEHREASLPDRLDQAVAGAELDAERPSAWWGLVAGLQWVLLLCVLAGALWLLALVGLGFLQLDDVVPLPRVEGIPLPTLLLLGGLLAGALLAMLSRPLVAATAARRARVARRRIRERLDRVAATDVIEPITAQREAYRRFCRAVARAAARG